MRSIIAPTCVFISQLQLIRTPPIKKQHNVATGYDLTGWVERTNKKYLQNIGCFADFRVR